MLNDYLAERKRKYPTKENIDQKNKLIYAKKKRSQILNLSEKIQDYTNRTGNKRTPAVLRFLKEPKHNPNIIEEVLKKEIDSEYSAILQCFRYFVNENFFNQPTLYDLKNKNYTKKTKTNNNNNNNNNIKNKKSKNDDNQFEYEDEYDMEPDY